MLGGHPCADTVPHPSSSGLWVLSAAGFSCVQPLDPPPVAGTLTPIWFHISLQVFVWVGKDSQEEEKTEALSSGEDQVYLWVCVLWCGGNSLPRGAGGS